MRAHLCLALALSGCSLDWSPAQSKDGGGAGGGGGAVGGSGGTGATTNGGSGGQAGDGAAAGAAGACAANACVGQECNVVLPCGVTCQGPACPICHKAGDSPKTYCLAEGCLVSTGIAGGSGVDVSCNGACADVCDKFGLCCVSGICASCP